MDKPIVGIIGFGIVGRAIAHGFAQLVDFRIYDINPSISENTIYETVTDSDYIFVCVPTPMNIDTGEFDTSIIDSVIDSISSYVSDNGKIVIIKSTVIPGTTQRYIDKYPDMNIVFCPEFLTERSFKLDFINTSRVIFGMKDDEETMDKLIKLFEMKFPATPIFFTDPTTAEMVKYTSNSFFCVKLSFFNEIYDMCDKLGIDYNTVIPMVIADGRIGNSHHTVPGHDGLRGFGGKCFPKDLNAMIAKAKELGIEPKVMESAWLKNIEVREKRDWEDIEGATS